MKLTIKPTEKVILVDGIPMRAWKGDVQDAIRVLVFIPSLAEVEENEPDALLHLMQDEYFADGYGALP